MTQINNNALELTREQKLLDRIGDNNEMPLPVAAELYVRSGLFTAQSLAAAIVKMDIGRSLGISAIASLQQIHVIPTKNNTTAVMMGGVLIGGLVKKSPKYDYSILELTDDHCEIQFFGIENGKKIALIPTETYTMQDASNQGISGKFNWQIARKNMLFYRCISNGVKKHAPDLTMFPIYTEGENVQEFTREAEFSIIEEKDGAHPITKKKLAKKVKPPEPVVAEAEIIEPVLTEELTTRMRDAVKVATKRLQDKESEWMHPNIRNSAGFAEIIRNEIAFVANKYDLSLSKLEKQIMWKMPKPKAEPKPKPMTVEEMQDKQQKSMQEPDEDTEDTNTFEKSETAKMTAWARLFNDFKTRKRITEAFLKKFDAGIIRKWREMGYHAEIETINAKYFEIHNETAPWIITNTAPVDAVEEAPPKASILRPDEKMQAQESKVENFPPQQESQQESKKPPKIKASLFDANDVDLSDWGGDND